MSYVPICKENELEDGKIMSVPCKHFQIALAKVKDSVFAFEDICTHDGSEISSGTLNGEIITCPRHMAEFNIRDGSVKCMPAFEPLKTFAIKVEKGEVFVNIEE